MKQLNLTALAVLAAFGLAACQPPAAEHIQHHRGDQQLGGVRDHAHLIALP